MIIRPVVIDHEVQQYVEWRVGTKDQRHTLVGFGSRRGVWGHLTQNSNSKHH